MEAGAEDKTEKEDPSPNLYFWDIHPPRATLVVMGMGIKHYAAEYCWNGKAIKIIFLGVGIIPGKPFL